MKFDNVCVIRVPRSKLWDFMTVIPNVAKCLPGVEEVTELEGGKFAGIIMVKVGIVKMRLSGKITIEVMDKERHLAIMSVQAADQRISGMIQGKLRMNLEELVAGETKLSVETDLNLFGKIGEFGGPIIKKKADQMMAEFAKNVAAGVATTTSSASNNS
jgi:carbon monoxide dehydrogenase subunit G